MRPYVVLLGFVLGSAAGITFSLFGVAVVVAVLQGDYPRFEGELAPLLRNLGIFAILTVLAALSFYAEIRALRWRRACQLGLGLALAALGAYYWPG